jgi:hypothetical protein
MWPGIYPEYKDGDSPIKADNGLSLENTKKLRDIATDCRNISRIYLMDDMWNLSLRYREFHQKIEDVIGHPKYYI